MVLVESGKKDFDLEFIVIEICALSCLDVRQLITQIYALHD